MLHFIPLLALIFMRVSEASVSQQCISRLMNLESGPWLAAIDAWGKPVGVLRGTFTSLGDYYACRALDKYGYQYGVVKSALVLHANTGEVTRLPSQLGVCLMPQCLNKVDLQAMFDNIGRDHGHQDNATRTLDKVLSGSLAPVREGNSAIEFVVTSVRPLRESEWTPGPIVMLVLIGIVVLTVLKATISEWKRRRDEERRQTELDKLDEFLEADHLIEGELEKEDLLPRPNASRAPSPPPKCIMSSFSLYNTLPMLFQTEQRHHTELAILNTIRTLSMLWVIYCHSVSQLISEVQVDVLDFVDWAKSWQFMPVTNGFLSVDSFFYMSTFLVGYMLFQSPRMCEKFNYTKYVLLRFLRTTPTYMFVLFTWYLLLPFMGQGPLWYERQDERPSQCEKYWWANVIYINNFVPEFLTQSCMGWSWYLAADFQLYLLAPIFVLPLGLKKYRPYALFVYIGGFLASAALVIGLSIAYNLASIAVPDIHRPNVEINVIVDQWQKLFYGKPYPRFALMIIAIGSAYLMTLARRKYQQTGTRPRSIWLWLMRLLGAGMLVAIIYLPYEVAHNFEPWPLAASVSYNFLSRVFWAIGLSLLIWPSVVYPDSSLAMKSFVEWSGWALSARLTYCVYLIHCIILIVTYGETVRAQPFTKMGSLIMFGSTVFWSYLVGALLYITVEAPTGALVKLLTQRK